MSTTTVEIAPEPDDLEAALRVVLRTGLPVRGESCGQALLALQAVRARSLDPADRASRVQALDALLREQLDRLENTDLAPAARLLFGADPASSGAALMQRRAVAATAAGKEANHFRKHIEPKLLGLLAWQLRRDSENFTTIHAEPPDLRAARGPWQFPADVFAWEAAEHQQTIAWLWSCIYALRAELLRVARLISMTATHAGDAGDQRDGDGEAIRAAADLALWRHAQLLAVADHYRRAYGPHLLHARSPLGPDEVAAFAGWTPPLGPADQRRLIGSVERGDGVAEFTTRLAAAGGQRLADAWCWDLTHHTTANAAAAANDAPDDDLEGSSR